MKLLIITQTVDKEDDALGFFHEWIRQFSEHYEQVTVICLGKGTYTLPPNVRVFSLGKEEGKGNLTYIFRLFKCVWHERKNYNHVFVHMNPEYIVLCGWLWKVLSKKIGLWYIHRSVTTKLKIAEKYADVIFTSSKESFQIPSKKVVYSKHGIDFSHFNAAYKKPGIPLMITHIGRITPIKNCDTLIEAAHIMGTDYATPVQITFVGKPTIPSDREYKKNLLLLIEKYGLQDSVTFVGGVSYAHMPQYIEKSDITVNLAPTGGMDKAVLESMAGMRPVFVSNTAFKELFNQYTEVFMFEEKNAKDLAQKIAAFLHSSEQEKKLAFLYDTVKREFDLTTLITFITSHLHIPHEASR